MKKITIMIIPPGSSRVIKFQLAYPAFYFILLVLVFVFIYSIWLIFNFSNYNWEKQKTKELKKRYAVLVKEREKDRKRLANIRKELSDMETMLKKVSSLMGINTGYNYNSSQSDNLENDYETKWLGDKLKEYNYISRDSFLRLTTPLFIPVEGWISSGFGKRKSPFTGETMFHLGVDIVAPEGRKVRAAADGIVINITDDTALGKVIYLLNNYGYVSIYGHNSKIFKHIGDTVKVGEVIAEIGVTGKTTGPHLHYQLELLNLPINPAYSGMKISDKKIIK